MAEPTPDTPQEAVEAEARDHIGQMMFDPLEGPDPDCVLCREASRLGLWQEWGYDDPLAGAEADDG